MAAHQALSSSDDPSSIRGLLSDMLTLVEGNMSEERAEKWIEVALLVLHAEPAEAIEEAVQAGIRKIRFRGEIVPFITAWCDDYRVRAEKHYQRMMLIQEALTCQE